MVAGEEEGKREGTRLGLYAFRETGGQMRGSHSSTRMRSTFVQSSLEVGRCLPRKRSHLLPRGIVSLGNLFITDQMINREVTFLKATRLELSRFCNDSRWKVQEPVD